mgnify:CR=1 FL=1
MTMPKITKIEITTFTWDIKGIVHARAFHYDPDSTLTFHGMALRITTEDGAVGEYAGSGPAAQEVAAAARAATTRRARWESPASCRIPQATHPTSGGWST